MNSSLFAQHFSVKWLVSRRSGSGRIVNMTFLPVTSCTVIAGESTETDTSALTRCSYKWLACVQYFQTQSCLTRL